MTRHRQHAPAAASERGTTLVELMIVVLLVGTIGAVGLTAVTSVSRTHTTTDAIRDNMDESRIALDRVRRELRGARRVFDDPTGNGRHLEFWVDTNGDDEIQPSEIVNYELVTTGDRTQLVRWTAANPGQRQAVAHNLIPNETFVYDQPSPQTRLVTVTLVVDAGGDRDVDPRTVEAQVRLRNVE